MTLKTGLLALGIFLIAAAPAVADWNEGDYHKMHFPQLPDPTGLDVNFSFRDEDNATTVADDFQCSATGPILDIHLWVSWRHEDIPVDIMKAIDIININIFKDAGGAPGAWQWGYNTRGNYVYVPAGQGPQGWLDPPALPIVSDHYQYFQINIDIPADVAFEQTEGEIYWLALTAAIHRDNANEAVGWKTSLQQFGSPAMFYLAPFGQNPWTPLQDVTGAPIDMAFVITA